MVCGGSSRITCFFWMQKAHTFITSEEYSKMRVGLVALGDVGEGRKKAIIQHPCSHQRVTLGFRLMVSHSTRGEHPQQQVCRGNLGQCKYSRSNQHHEWGRPTLSGTASSDTCAAAAVGKWTKASRLRLSNLNPNYQVKHTAGNN